jgi:glucose-6-phosphate 1-dehydrogenase
MNPATAARRVPSRARGSVPRPQDHIIVLFGATGDLARRKLLPGLFHLATAGLLPEGYRIIGSAPGRSALTDEEFRAHARAAVTEFGISKPGGPDWDLFEKALSFGSADPDHTAPLTMAIARAEREPAGRVRLGGRDARRGGPGQGRERDHREAIRDRPAVGAGAE